MGRLVQRLVLHHGAAEEIPDIVERFPVIGEVEVELVEEGIECGVPNAHVSSPSSRIPASRTCFVSTGRDDFFDTSILAVADLDGDVIALLADPVKNSTEDRNGRDEKQGGCPEVAKRSRRVAFVAGADGVDFEVEQQALLLPLVQPVDLDQGPRCVSGHSPSPQSCSRPGRLAVPSSRAAGQGPLRPRQWR